MATSTRRLLFVGSYAAADQASIHAFDFDEADGSLTSRGALGGIANPSFLVVHPHQDWLYAVSETGLANDGRSGAVYAFRFQRDPFSMQLINQRASGGDHPCHLAINASGRWLLVSNYGSGEVALFPIEGDGALGEMSDLVRHHGAGPDPERQAGPHAHSATLSPDKRRVLIADLGIDQLVTYQFNAEAGQLSHHAFKEIHPGAGPRHAAFHPGGQYLYLANELDNSVIVYAYQTVTGSLYEIQRVTTLPRGAPENAVAHIQLSSSGQRLYVSNRGHDSVAVYAVARDGRLKSLGFPACGGQWPRHFSLSPGGRWLLVANQHSHDATVLPLQREGEEVGQPVAQVEVSQPACVCFASV